MANKKRITSLLLAGSLLTAALAFSACGGSDAGQENTAPAAEEQEAENDGTDASDASGDTDAAGSGEVVVEEADESTSYTYLITTNVDSYFYEEYEENPAYLYWASMGWDADGDGIAKKISIDFTAPPAGGESDYYNTLLATGEYPDVMSTAYTNATAAQLYEEGIALDLTDYVDQYMPNYKAWLEEHPEYANMLTNRVDGESRILQLYGVGDEVPERGNGFVYRRDWLVKYGTNPETGEAFTGGYDDDGVWSDDVVFPSGNTFPVYISDWEWMIPILGEAMDDLGIEDGYLVQVPNSGYFGLGDLVTGFGGIGASWYIGADGRCDYGADSDGMRAYMQCMHNWYENGWLDETFMENPDSIFWDIDIASVYSGKVGVWYALKSAVGSQLDTSNGDESDYTYGICAAAAPSPINDVYGDASVQNKEPICFFGASLIGQSDIVTVAAKDKDIATLLTAIDYLYGPEGGLLKTAGLSGEQVSEIDSTFYSDNGFADGFYTVEERDGEEWYVLPAEDTLEQGLKEALILQRVTGLGRYHNVDQSFDPNLQAALEIWEMYDNPGYIISAVTAQLTPEQTEDYSLVSSNLSTYLSQTMPMFVTGELDVEDDAVWQEHCDTIAAYNPYDHVDNINAILGVD